VAKAEGGNQKRMFQMKVGIAIQKEKWECRVGGMQK
jgi:hypothetical protein